jgi:hypothetical protein
MEVADALCFEPNAVAEFTNRNLRALAPQSGLLGQSLGAPHN